MREGILTEVHCRSWGARVEALEMLECFTSVKGEGIDFTRGDTE